MRDTKLIFIDGLPGSGKTTTAGLLVKRAASSGIPVACFLEYDADHPLNVGGALHPAGSTTGAALFAHYTPDAYVVESLQRWRTFVAAVDAGETVQILESYPYQNSVRILLQMDVAPDRIAAYAADVEEIARPLRPILIYLDRHDPTSALQAIVQQRGADWAAYVADLVTDSPAGRRRGLQGIAGAIALMTEYKAFIDSLVSSSTLPRLVLEDCGGRWEECHRQIWEFLAS